jgi:hypothetical protein
VAIEAERVVLFSRKANDTAIEPKYLRADGNGFFLIDMGKSCGQASGVGGRQPF